jgi:hypothetical protein
MDMLKQSLIAMGLMLVFFSITGMKASADTMTPIFDGKVAPKLKFKSCEGWKDLPIPQRSIMEAQAPWIMKKFKSLKSSHTEEVWVSGNPPNPPYRIVTIESWSFEYPEDAGLYPETNILTGSAVFPGWDKIADIGDKTCWLAPFDMLFVKNKTLVRIFINPLDIDDATKNYTRKIAESICKKL